MAEDHPYITDDSLSTLSLPFVEHLYEHYRHDRALVAADWQKYFDRLSDGHAGVMLPAHGAEEAVFQHRVEQLVEAFRIHGHTAARLDPLGTPGEPRPELDPAYWRLTDGDLSRCTANPQSGADCYTLADLIAHLQRTYCQTIGVEFMHIDEPHIRQWMQERMEVEGGRPPLLPEEQERLLTALTQAVELEEFLRRRYVGAKTFSLEGCESLIPLLGEAVEKAAADGVEEVVLGMAHRGRLNVLANVIGKPLREILREFEDTSFDHAPARGDVRYHLGYSAARNTAGGRRIHLSLCFNPSHLEFINPVLLGRVRAKQDRGGDTRRRRVLGVLIHGDAAFAAEGVVQETLNLSELDAYRTGGTLHVIVNNQIGFTTPPQEGRSSRYATAIGRMLQVPILHVNGDDPEAVMYVLNLGLEFLRRFERDVIIDLYGYRRHGHNEADEPSFTQPTMYSVIRNRPSVREIYRDALLGSGAIAREQVDGIAARCRERLEAEFADRNQTAPAARIEPGAWRDYSGGIEAEAADVSTGVPEERLMAVLLKLVTLPESFHLHHLLHKSMNRRREMLAKQRPVDWSAAEALALGTLALDGFPIRLTGQDSARGTFGQRHAVLHDAETGTTFEPLQNLAPDQAPVNVHNSPLSETGVLGFEYGYSLDFPAALVLWEAQFGDFANAAQVIIDQFIAAGEAKWRRLSGLVLLLPHGWEGQGPEHSSARLERFLTLAADDNIQVVNATTPAQYFHLLRRQALRKWRKPLIVMTPKSMLRHPQAVSELEEFVTGEFHRVIPDPDVVPQAVKRVLLCSGKVYYDLLAKREELARDDVAIIRVEQLYPFPDGPLNTALAGFADRTPIAWVQEEPENMGAWRFLRCRFGDTLYGRFPFDCVSRPQSAAPATGSPALHKLQREQILEAAFANEGVAGAASQTKKNLPADLPSTR